jgi:spermidine/putrescine transport system ATP-binding protein
MARYAGQVQSVLFDGANSAVLIIEQQSRIEFRVALPQTGRLADLKPGAQVHFGFDPQRAICFAATAAGNAAGAADSAHV